MFGLGPTELIIIGVIVLLLFGARRLPDIGKGLGGAIREFRKVKDELGSKEAGGKDNDNNREGTKKNGSSQLEEKVVDKVLDQVPGVKKAVEVKRKAEKIKEVLK